MTYLDIVGGSWVNASLFSESIPHLLHWDLAYLWTLEKENQLRPHSWEHRIEAWRILVSELLLGRLTVEAEQLEPPLLHYTKPHGIDQVQWVVRGADRLGVLSPTVLVRPLPDFEREDSPGLEESLPRTEASDKELRHFVKLAVDRVKGAGSYGERMARVLEREFLPEVMKNPPQGRFQDIQILNRIHWVPKDKTPEFSKVRLLIFSGPGERTFVPCCSCGRSLTRRMTDPPIEVRSSDFEVTCLECDRTSSLDLRDFFVWLDRDNQRAIVWDKESVFLESGPEKGVPPPANIEEATEDGIVVFEFNPARINQLSDDRRFLRLRFPGNVKVQKHGVRDLFFEQILLLGGDEKGRDLGPVPVPLPIKPEWLEAFEHIELVQFEDLADRCVFRRLELKGLPKAIVHSVGGRDLHREPKLSLGLFPDPGRMPESWKCFRVFLDGEPRADYRLIESDASSHPLPWLGDYTEGPPRVFSVRTSNSDSCGVTYVASWAPLRPAGAKATVHMGLDFGTTHSVIRYQFHNEADDQPLSPSQTADLVFWLAHGPTSASKAMGDALPSRHFGNKDDPHLIPSALWARAEHALIRWSSDKPTQDSVALTGFKWDRVAGENQSLRKAYLREALLLALPHVIIGNNLDHVPVVQLGVAYPLAFDHTTYKGFQRLWTALKDELSTAGIHLEVGMLSESHASLKATAGRPDPHNVYLVADMGGGTMDLALFPGKGIPLYQVGSVRFGGETYFRSLAFRREDNDEAAQQQAIWRFRDAVFDGNCCDLYGRDKAIQRFLTGFMTCALELLRTMVAAHREANPEVEVHVLLVGNGWRLVEAFNTDLRKRGAKAVFEDFFRAHFISLEGSGMSHYDASGDNMLARLPSSKHIVAFGALLNSMVPQDRIDQPETRSPAGRSVKFIFADKSEETVHWSRIVGHGRPLFDRHESDIRAASIKVQFNDFPVPGSAWQTRLARAFGKATLDQIPYPLEDRMAGWLVQQMQESPQPIMTKGPLQLLLEQYWVNELT